MSCAKDIIRKIKKSLPYRSTLSRRDKLGSKCRKTCIFWFVLEILAIFAHGKLCIPNVAFIQMARYSLLKLKNYILSIL